MSYDLLETIETIRRTRDERLANNARYMYETARDRDGRTGEDLLVVQFFYYRLSDLPEDLPASVKEHLHRLRCWKLSLRKGATRRDVNQSRYWWHIRNNCCGVPLYEYVQCLAVEARVTGFVLSAQMGTNISFIASQAMDLYGLRGSIYRVHAYQLLAQLAWRAGVTRNQIDHRAHQFYGFYKGFLRTVSHSDTSDVPVPSRNQVGILPRTWYQADINVEKEIA